MPLEIRFRKSGKEIKAAIASRVVQLQQRLDSRSTVPNYGHGRQAAALYSQDDISSEEKEEIGQLCRRIFEIEQERHRLELIQFHLRDDQEFELPFEDLVAYGFETSLEYE